MDKLSKDKSVLIVGGYLPPPYGGIAKYMQASIPFLLKAGYRIFNVQTSRGNPNDMFVNLGNYYTGSGNTRILPVAWFVLTRPFLVLSIFRAYLPVFFKMGLFRYLRSVTGIILWYYAGNQLASGNDIRVVHAYDEPWLRGYAAFLLAKSLKAKFVMTTFGEVVPHDSELCQFDQSGEAFKEISQYVLDRADIVASMTHHCIQQVTYVGYKPENVRLVRLVVGMEEYHPGVDGVHVRRKFAPMNEPLLLFVGQVRPRKGPQILVSAMPRVLSSYPKTRLLIVGPDYGYADELKALAKDLRVEDSIEFVGAVPDTDLPAYYAACDIFLFPTCTHIECLGLVFVQAMFLGKPVIATRIAGAPEVIRDGVDGFLVNPNDTEAFADRIEQLLHCSAEQRNTIGKAARERVFTLFNEQEVMEDIVNVYEELIRA